MQFKLSAQARQGGDAEDDAEAAGLLEQVFLFLCVLVFQCSSSQEYLACRLPLYNLLYLRALRPLASFLRGASAQLALNKI